MKRQWFKKADGGKGAHFQSLCTVRREGWVGAGGGTDGGEREEEVASLGTAHRWGEPMSVHLR